MKSREPKGEGIGAMSWDAEHNQLWIATATSLPQRVYTVQLDKANKLLVRRPWPLKLQTYRAMLS